MTEDPASVTSDIRPACEPEGARKRASEVLDDFLAHEHGERIVLGDLLAILGDRAFGALLLLLAIPNVLPVPGLSTATGLVTALVAAQMALGRRAPWLPRRLAAVGIDRAVFLKVVARAHPHVRRIERRLLRPRLPALTSPLAERAVGLVVVVLAVVLSLPIVFGNQPPALAIALIALGLIEKDGAFVLAGLVASVLALGVVLAVVTGLFHGVTFLFNGLFT